MRRYRWSQRLRLVAIAVTLHALLPGLEGLMAFTETTDSSHGNVSQEVCDDGICSAHAVASVIQAAEKRLGGKQESHEKLFAELAAKYGRNGTNVTEVLKETCLQKKLTYKEVSEAEGRKVLEKGETLLATIALTPSQWKKFQRLARQKPGNVISAADVGKPALGEKASEHAMVMSGIDSHQKYYKIKKSWGHQHHKNTSGHHQHDKNSSHHHLHHKNSSGHHRHNRSHSGHRHDEGHVRLAFSAARAWKVHLFQVGPN
eukprot:Skav223973  [mRNA]  locus=scaffold1107:180036:180812:- [translate_table: standard]